MAAFHTKTSKKGETIYYSLVEKQSERGLSYNQRLFILLEGHYFGYTKDYDKRNLGAFDVNKLKVQVPLQDLRKIVPKDDTLALYINQYEKGKLKSVKWTFKMATEALAFSWLQILTKQNNLSRKSTQYKKTQVHENSSQLRQHGTEPNIFSNILAPQTKLIQTKPVNQIPEKKEEQEEKFQNTKNKQHLNRFSHVPKNFYQQQSQIERNTFSFQKSSEFQQKSLGELLRGATDRLKIKQPIQIKENAQEENSLEVEKKTDIKPSISQILQKNIDKEKIEKQLSQYRQNKKQLGQKMPKKANINIEKQKFSFFNYFRPPPSEINDQHYYHFLQYCKQKMIEIVQNVSRREKKEKQEEIIQLQDLTVTLMFMELKQIPDKSNICDNSVQEKYARKFLNMDYLWKIITHDAELQKIFYVPMCCVCEYRGFSGFFTVKFDDSKKNSSLNDFSHFFELLAEKSGIHMDILQNKEAINFVRVKDYFVIAEVNQFLPILTGVNEIMRPQLFQEVYLQKKEIYYPRKGKKQQNQQIKLYKSIIEEKVSQLTGNLEKFQESIVHPSQLIYILNSYGLSNKFLTRIHNQVSNIFTKGIIKTEVAVKMFSLIYRKKIQDMTMNKAEACEFVINLLNAVFSGNQGSEPLWKMITLHGQMHYGLVIGKEDINKGYFLLGLEDELGLKIHTTYTSCERMFSCQKFVQNIQFLCKVEPCRIHWLEGLDQGYTLEEVQEIIHHFHLHTKNLPFYIKQNKNYYNQLLCQISQYHNPEQFDHLFAADPGDLSTQECRVGITRIKWAVKEKQLNSKEMELQTLKVKEKVGQFYGEYHPFYNEIYELLIMYNVEGGNFEKAIRYCKLSMANMIQLCGGNNMHVGLASKYFEMGECFWMWGKIDDAISQYKKAKNILEFNDYVSGKEYALIQLKLGLLYFSKLKDGECEKLVEGSFAILKNQAAGNAEELVQCLQLMNRCVKDAVGRESLVVNTLEFMKSGLEEGLINDQQSVRLGKIIVQHFLTLYGQAPTAQVQQYLEQVSDKITQGYTDIEQATENFQTYIINEQLVPTLEDFNTKAEQYLELNNRKLPITDKHLLVFNQLIISLISCFGEGFILGVYKNSS